DFVCAQRCDDHSLFCWLPASNAAVIHATRIGLPSLSTTLPSMTEPVLTVMDTSSRPALTPWSFVSSTFTSRPHCHIADTVRASAPSARLANSNVPSGAVYTCALPHHHHMSFWEFSVFVARTGTPPIGCCDSSFTTPLIFLPVARRMITSPAPVLVVTR